jgi:hypothetical protein
MDDMKLGMAGYGEVGKIFAQGLKGRPGITSISAWDLKFANDATGELERGYADQAGIASVSGMAALCADANLIISAVTASNTLGHLE